MRSPFAIFRKNQKTMMVVLVGLSMIGFVLLGAVQDPSNMPKGLVFIAVLAVVGGVAWIAGMSSGRSAEYGSWGLVLGALVAVFLTVMADQPPLAVLADTGDLTVTDLQNLRTRREIANRFVGDALRMTRDPRELRELVGRYSFGFMQRTMDKDIVTGELLRREANRLGLQVPEPAVTEFIRKVTDDKMSASTFKEIRTNLHVSGSELYDILGDELQARMAAEFLYGVKPDSPQRYERLLPPEQYWELYEQMYVKERLEVAAVPVREFIDESAEPTSEEIARLFGEYQKNSPFQTPDGQIEEGRPGFMQPRRVQIGYLEAAFDDFKSGIAAVTDEDIEAYFQERYVQPAAEAAARAADARSNQPDTSGPQLPEKLELDLPELPTPPTDGDAPAGDAPAEEKPAGSEPSSETPSTDPPASEPAAESPEKESPAAETSDGEGTEPGADEATSQDAKEQPGLFSVADGDETTTATETADDQPAIADEATSDATPGEENAAEPPATDPAATEPAAVADDATETPTAETTPADEPNDSPAKTPPEAAIPGSGEAAIPPAPQSDVPLLDDSLREQIRTAIEEERTVALLQAAVEQAAGEIDKQVGYFTSVPKSEPDYMSPEQAADVLKTYAAVQNLHYAETPFLSDEELFKSEDHPVGAARDVNDPNGRPLTSVVYQTGPQDIFRPIVVSNPLTQSWFVAWKIAERKPYTPTSPNDEQVHDQIVKTWRELQARQKAEARARELAATATATGQPLASSFGEATITGKEGGLFLTVTETPEFSWLSSPGAMGPNPFAIDPPRIQDPPGVERVYEDFMRVVFDELQPGEVGVAPNSDRSIYYVVRVVFRTPTPDDVAYAAFRERFLREPVFRPHPVFAIRGIEWPSIYQSMAMQQTLQREPDWAQGPRGLFVRHGAVMVEANPEQPQS